MDPSLPWHGSNSLTSSAHDLIEETPEQGPTRETLRNPLRALDPQQSYSTPWASAASISVVTYVFSFSFFFMGLYASPHWAGPIHVLWYETWILAVLAMQPLYCLCICLLGLQLQGSWAVANKPSFWGWISVSVFTASVIQTGGALLLYVEYSFFMAAVGCVSFLLVAQWVSALFHYSLQP